MKGVILPNLKILFGEEIVHKSTGTEAWEMKLEKEKGVWKFSPKEWLDEDQIKQAFSRIATTRKKTKAKAVSAAIDEEEEEEDMIAEHDAIDEQEIVLEIQRELEKHEEIDIDLSHPMKVHEILRIIFSCKFCSTNSCGSY